MKRLLTYLFFLLFGIGMNTSKVFAGDPPHIKVLYVGYSGGTGEPKNPGCSNSFTADIGTRTYIDVWEVIYGNTQVTGKPHIPSNFYQGACGGSNPDLIIFSGADGSSTADPNWIYDVQNLVKAADGTNASIPQIHERSSHLFKWPTQHADQGAGNGFTNEGYLYRELLGAWSFDHDAPPMNESTYAFQNTGNPILSGVNTASQWYPNDGSGAISGLYYNTIEPSYNNSLQVLLDCSKPVNYCYCQPNWGDIGLQNNVPIAWSYLYKGNVRMFSETYYSTGGQFNSRFNDIMARAVIWCAGKDNATYLKGVTPPSYLSLPNIVESENYSAMSGIQTENCSEGGLNVGYIDNGDWMDFNVNPSSSGTYILEFRVASASSGGSLDIKSGSTVLGSVSFGSTGGWQNWTTVSKSVNLNSGNQTIRIQATSGGWNFNWWKASTSTGTVAVTGVSVNPTSASIAVNVTQQITPTVNPGNATNKTVSWSSNNTSIATVDGNGLVTGKAAGNATITVLTQDGGKTDTCPITVTGGVGGGNYVSLPSTVEAENYSVMSGIQTENCSEGGLNVGYIDNGDWMDYNVNPSSSGTYKLEFRVASQSAGGNFNISSGGTSLGSVIFASTGGWQNWTTVSKSVNLNSGNQTIRIQATSGGWNFNWWKASTGGGSGCTNPIVSNSGFENSNTSGWGASYGSVSATTSNPHSGSYCGQITGVPGAFDQVVSGLIPNQSYTLTAWMKVSSGDEIRLGAKNFGGTEINTPVTSTGWTQVSVIFTTGTSGTTSEIYAWHSAGTGNVWVDDISITCNNALRQTTLAIPTQKNSISSGMQLNIYPNPVTNGILNIRLDGQTQDATVQIYTIVGKLVYSNSLRNNETKKIENLRAGMYVTRVSVNNITKTRKVLVK